MRPCARSRRDVRPGRSLGIDVGGTFTDAVLVSDGGECARPRCRRRRARRRRSSRRRQQSGSEDVDRFTHGTTIATNALLERRGARTAFVTTAGFEHLLHLRRQTRAHLYRPCAEHPTPLVPLERCVGVTGRMGPDGELAPLDLGSLPEIDAEAVAVCLLFSFRDHRHTSKRWRAELRRRLSGSARRRVARGRARVSRVRARVDDGRGRLPRARCWLGYLAGARRACGSGGPARAAASCAPRAASRPWTRLRRHRGLRSPLRSGGGSRRRRADRSARRVRERARVRHGRNVHRRLRDRRRRGAARARAEWAGSRCGCRRWPCTPSARVGARSCGRTRAARFGSAPRALAPSPVRPCYGRGGTRATVTDANLLLERLPTSLAGGVELDRDAAARALGELDPAAVIDVVDAEMVRALRVVSVEQGLDPRDFALVAFGGAGPLHACALADELGMSTVLVPAAAGCSPLSASSPPTSATTPFAPTSCRSPTSASCPTDGEADLRYVGQSFELTVPLGPDLTQRFHARTTSVTATPIARVDLELVAVRTAEIRAGTCHRLVRPSGQRPRPRRFSSSTARRPGCRPGWSGETDAHGTLVLRRTA